MKAKKLITLFALLAVFGLSQAQSFPNKPLRIIVPYPPGQASDQITRMVADKVSQAFNQPIIVENKPGAGGNLGTEIGAKSPADGYMMTIGTAALPISKLVYKKLTFDPINDFNGVTLMTTMPLVLVVPPGLKVNTVAELVEYAKSNPGKINFASSGIGTSHQLAGEMFKQYANVDITHVPYKGSPPAHVDLMGGSVDMMFDNIVAVGPHIKSGKLKALAVTSKTRSPIFPNVPTMQESGYPNIEAVAWFGVLVPKGTPTNVINRLNKEFVAALTMPEIKNKLQENGAQVVASSPDEFNAFMQSEVSKWANVINTAKIVLD
ncbi:MAG: tripartite tricarboxylate transporter substrate binding protein [Polynucleobacter sp.]|nr:tripartite tricarboxylate transporter substrate binding protein [Polynucleobacter sp.]MDZ4055771.1 tripartite tricarboxylate transporter substrate binding protein [Polynucleobacter sp.]